jgi:hypothetical protein
MRQEKKWEKISCTVTHTHIHVRAYVFMSSDPLRAKRRIRRGLNAEEARAGRVRVTNDLRRRCKGKHQAHKRHDDRVHVVEHTVLDHVTVHDGHEDATLEVHGIRSMASILNNRRRDLDDDVVDDDVDDDDDDVDDIDDDDLDDDDVDDEGDSMFQAALDCAKAGRIPEALQLGVDAFNVVDLAALTERAFALAAALVHTVANSGSDASRAWDDKGARDFSLILWRVLSAQKEDEDDDMHVPGALVEALLTWADEDVVTNTQQALQDCISLVLWQRWWRDHESNLVETCLQTAMTTDAMGPGQAADYLAIVAQGLRVLDAEVTKVHAERVVVYLQEFLHKDARTAVYGRTFKVLTRLAKGAQRDMRILSVLVDRRCLWHALRFLSTPACPVGDGAFFWYAVKDVCLFLSHCLQACREAVAAATAANNVREAQAFVHAALEGGCLSAVATTLSHPSLLKMKFPWTKLGAALAAVMFGPLALAPAGGVFFLAPAVVEVCRALCRWATDKPVQLTSFVCALTRAVADVVRSTPEAAAVAHDFLRECGVRQALVTIITSGSGPSCAAVADAKGAVAATLPGLF